MASVPLKVTEVMLASVVVVSSMATPTTRMRSVPPPMTCVHDSDVRPGDVGAGTGHRGSRVVGTGVALSRDAGIEA